MNDSKISVRYSKALFQTAHEKNLMDKVTEDMVLISGLCVLPETKELLEHPVIAPSKKKVIFSKLLEGNVQQITLSLINLLVENGRESFLPSIARDYIHETRKYKGVTEAVLTTAVPVDNKLKKEIAGLVENTFSTKVELKEVIDSSIIGGFVLRIDDNYIDASVKNKLRKVKKELLGSIKSR
ncbi:MAG TPA: ATP synthase F1 subunit delta [Bacteroidales bacterium]|nr:ATP synthase F1 subunit delta [Bacteroidales bacterium]